MISDKMVKAINGQITKEFYSAYLYLSMEPILRTWPCRGLRTGCASQATGGDRARNDPLQLRCRAQRPCGAGWRSTPRRSSLLRRLRCSRNRWRTSKSLLHQLARSREPAVTEKDHATRAMLDWFVKEQVEEEASAQLMVDRLKRLKDAPAALEMLDRELAGRSFAMPSPLAGK